MDCNIAERRGYGGMNRRLWNSKRIGYEWATKAGQEPVHMRVARGLGLMKCGLGENEQWVDTSFETSYLENTLASSRKLGHEQQFLGPLHGSHFSAYFGDISRMIMKGLES